MINRVLFYNSGGGIGDAIQILPLINTLRKEFKNAKLFYLCAHRNHFNTTLVDLNCKIDTLDLDIKYFGFRWWHALIVKKRIKKYNIQKFDLIIDLQSKIRNSLILKMIPHNYFISTCLNFNLSKPNIKIEKENKINNTIINAINQVYQTNYKLIDYDINTINKNFFDESKKLLPKKNYVGFSITQGNVYRKKEWPLNCIVETCNKIKEKNKIPVFFIEKDNENLKNELNRLIPDALFPEHETNIKSPALVICLATRIEFAVSIDNGVMHMLALTKIPMISLFGPTDSEKFAPEYKHSVVLDSKKIYRTKNLSAITVEDVLKAAGQFLNI
tara:strand:- start:677 stop:1666 length:990 start_codon:yes stop_codon:yes gene_type:complete